MKRVGVVALPMIFGPSQSFLDHVARLEQAGYPVLQISPYDGSPPPFLPYLTGPVADTVRNRIELAQSIDDHRLARLIPEAAQSLREDHLCDLVALLGFGYGASAALANANQAKAQAVIAWYPHLQHPQGLDKLPPRLEAIDCPVTLFYGQDDQETLDSRNLALHLTRQHQKNLRVFELRAAYAFADATIQDQVPSPYYQSEAAGLSWRLALQQLEQLSQN